MFRIFFCLKLDFWSILQTLQFLLKILFSKKSILYYFFSIVSSQFTQSLKFDSRKPPVPSRSHLVSSSATDPSFFKNGLGFFTGIRRNFRRKSETPLRRNNLTESFNGRCVSSFKLLHLFHFCVTLFCVRSEEIVFVGF